MQRLWSRSLSASTVEAFSLAVESDLQIPFLLLLPPSGAPSLVVIAFSQGGKDRFLKHRARELEKLLAAGVAVCLPDLRGTGEVSPAFDRSDFGPHGMLARREFSLGNTLLGARLKDLRSLLRHLEQRPDLKPDPALWGDSFSPANPDPLFVDELQFPGGPQSVFQAEPLGAHLALLVALFEEGAGPVAAFGGLAGYLSVLDHPFTYVPQDALVPGLLRVADILDLMAAAGRRPLLVGRFVNGRNQPLGPPAMETLRKSLEEDPEVIRSLSWASRDTDVADWLIRHLNSSRILP